MLVIKLLFHTTFMSQFPRVFIFKTHYKNGKGTPYSKLKSSQSDTLDFTKPFILKLISRTKPMVTNLIQTTCVAFNTT